MSSASPIVTANNKHSSHEQQHEEESSSSGGAAPDFGTGDADVGDSSDPMDKGGGGSDPMDEDNLSVNHATFFCIRMKQPISNLQFKMSVPELCRNFSSNANPPFWIPIHIVILERPTESTVFNVIADSPRDSVLFIEWLPSSCPRALLISNFHGRITIWSHPSHGSTSLVKDATNFASFSIPSCICRIETLKTVHPKSKGW